LMPGLIVFLLIGLPVQIQSASASTIGTSTKDLKFLAEGNNTMAQRVLGKRYAFGIEDVERDIDKAVFWLQKAADKDDAEAQYYLGQVYQNSLHDLVQAHMWFSLIRVQRKGLAVQAEINKKAVETKMTPQQIEEAQTLASEWLKKHRLPDQPVAPQIKQDSPN